jgi:hypothetical protein
VLGTAERNIVRNHRLVSAVLALAAGLLGVAIGGNVASASAAPAGLDCHPDYQGACVPMNQGDVDCGDLDSSVIVVGDDVYHLDDDRDGVGCEGNGGTGGGGGGGTGGSGGSSIGGDDEQPGGLADTGATSATLVGAATAALLLGGLGLLAARRRTA